MRLAGTVTLRLVYLLALGMFFAPTLLAQNIITTVAGGGNPGGLATAGDIVTPSRHRRRQPGQRLQ